ncbi:MAG: hypothetical protein WD178_05195 [Actinomycetota bacterium]
MGTEDDKGFDFDIPVVADRREFFEQEALVSGPPDELSTDLAPDDVTESLKAMRESASIRTGSAQQSEDGPRSAGAGTKVKPG